MARKDQPITLSDLARTWAACNRVENEIDRRLAELHLGPRTPAHVLTKALQDMQAAPPSWCEPEAWRVKLSYPIGYVRAFGNLDLYNRLRNRSKNNQESEE